ncbi:MAG: AMP-binding protein [Bryobacterales bacterium]|nr:AMP-binding protein [Bryobacterales bacterium]
MLVQDFLRDSAARLPDKVALICQGRRLTYGWLDQAADRMANALRQLGVARGDRVALYLNNSVELVVGIFGVVKAGGVFAVMNRSAKAEKLLHVLNDCQARVLFTDDRALSSPLPERLFDRVPDLRVVACSTRGGQYFQAPARIWDFGGILDSLPPEPGPCPNIDLDLACLIYTSGTTGEPKGVMCGHSNVVFATQAIVRYLRNSSEDKILTVLPLSSSYGHYQLLATFLTGGTLVLEPSFAFPVEVLERMATERVTGFAGVPTIYSIMLGMDLQGFDLSSLRYLTNASAALPVEHVKRLRHAFPKVELFLMHGLTEVARTMYLPPDQAEIRPGSSGIPLPGTELWVENESGCRLGPGEIGELVVRGRHVMRGYWGNPERSAERFRPGHLPGERICYTGDLFRTDKDGYYYFVSRKDDIIMCRGEKVAPCEVENVLYTIPGVQDAAVIGVPDPLVGQAVKAFIVAPGAKLTAAQVMGHCRARLEDVMLPRYIEFRSDLPKSPGGKIQKRYLS